MKVRLTIFIYNTFVFGILGFLCMTPRVCHAFQSLPDSLLLHEPWVVSENLYLKIYFAGGLEKTLTSGYKDYKPSWSKDGKRITFFGLHSTGWLGALDLKRWRTSICVINADGKGFKELTSGKHQDFNPTWTWDGTNRILFNRYSRDGGWLNQVYWILPEGVPGEEQLISDPSYPYCEWVTGALKDGRSFVDRISETSFQSFLLTPEPGKAVKYEAIRRPTHLLWHKLNISPSETRVTYMLDHDRRTGTFKDAVICYADFDVETLTISNQVMITRQDSGCICEYPCWNRDESLILYDSNQSGAYQVYAY